MTSPGADGAWANPSGQPQGQPQGEPQGWAAPGYAAAPPPGYPSPGYPSPAYPPPGYPQPAYGQPAGSGPPPNWGAPYRPLDLRPGIVPLRPLAVGDVLDGSLSMIRRYFRPVIAVSVLVAIVVEALGFLIQTGTADTESFGAKFGYFFLSILLSQLGGLLLAGPISALAGEAVLGRPMTLEQVWAKTRPRAGAIFVTALLVALVSIVGIPFLAIPFVLALVYFAFGTQAAVLEKLPARKAMSRSVALVRGSFWRIFGILILAGLIAGVVALVLEIPFFVIAAVTTGHLFTTTAGASSTASRAIIDIGGTLAAMFTLPFSAGVHSLLYMDQRMRNEGLDVSLRQAASTSGPR